MSLKSQSRATFALAGAAIIAVSWVNADVVKSDAPVAPTNDAPNPYKTIRDWVQLPPGRHLGSSTAVTIDRDGKSIWYSERCGVNGCFDHTTNTMSQLDTVFKLDVNGKILKNWGGGMIVSVHGIYVDKDDNIWITDYEDNGPLPAGRGRGRGGKKGGDPSSATGATASAPPTPVALVRPAGPIGPPPGSTKGHQVFKFNQDGKLLMTLGTPGGAAEPGYFYAPNAVILNKKGEIYVTEGHGRGNDRILKFTNDGKLIKTWGKLGTGPGEFDVPHCMAFDSKGRLYICDRNNNRIQVYDQNDNYITEFRQFSRPSGIFIDKHDNLYVADSESESVSRNHDGWKRGIRIGSLKDMKVTAFIPDPEQHPPSTSSAEGVAVDSAGNIYGAEVGQRDLVKYVKEKK